jgi:hypothetical protein
MGVRKSNGIGWFGAIGAPPHERLRGAVVEEDELPALLHDAGVLRCDPGPLNDHVVVGRGTNGDLLFAEAGNHRARWYTERARVRENPTCDKRPDLFVNLPRRGRAGRPTLWAARAAREWRAASVVAAPRAGRLGRWLGARRLRVGIGGLDGAARVAERAERHDDRGLLVLGSLELTVDGVTHARKHRERYDDDGHHETAGETSGLCGGRLRGVGSRGARDGRHDGGPRDAQRRRERGRGGAALRRVREGDREGARRGPSPGTRGSRRSDRPP